MPEVERQKSMLLRLLPYRCPGYPSAGSSCWCFMHKLSVICIRGIHVLNTTSMIFIYVARCLLYCIVCKLWLIPVNLSFTVLVILLRSKFDWSIARFGRKKANKTEMVLVFIKNESAEKSPRFEFLASALVSSVNVSVLQVSVWCKVTVENRPA